jgi:hypothetical protein
MTGRPLDLTQRQVRAIAEGARKAHCIAEVVIGKVTVRLVPEEHAIPKPETRTIDQRKAIRL